MTNINTIKKITGAFIALGGLFFTTQASASGLVKGDVIINEWNAVGPNKWLEDSGCDLQFSDCVPVNDTPAMGNGNEWIELVVIKEAADLRGLELHWTNGDSPAKSGILTFKSHVKWNGGVAGGGLKAGSIILVRAGGTDGYGQTAGQEIFPNRADLGCSATNGTWDEYIYVNSDGTYVEDNGDAFHVDNDDWMGTLIETTGTPDVTVQTWVGEDTSGADIVTGSGISSEEVGKLENDPQAAAANLPQVCDYNDGDTSTAGFANKWNSGANEQCFKGLTGCGTCTPTACN